MFYPPPVPPPTAPTPKPPIGIMPKSIHDDTRERDLIMACARYFEAGLPPRYEWLVELRDLIDARLRRTIVLDYSTHAEGRA